CAHGDSPEARYYRNKCSGAPDRTPIRRRQRAQPTALAPWPRVRPRRPRDTIPRLSKDLPERRMSTPAPQMPVKDASPDQTPLRFVTAASLFDGHDAAINIMRRLIQGQGAEVVHLGHNRSVEDVVRAAL